MSRVQRASTVFAISHLHLGGGAPAMMGRPDLLASFIDGLPGRAGGVPASSVELVIAGDFVDFLAAAPGASFTAEPREACETLGSVMTGSPFAPVFDALGRHVAAGRRLTVLLGNHDVELALPQVQGALLERIDAARHEVLFLTDGRAHRIGGALIEHGNRYDGANVNDFTGLRAITSALSRDEVPADRLRVSAGSEIVRRVVNPIKKEYPFIDSAGSRRGSWWRCCCSRSSRRCGGTGTRSRGCSAATGWSGRTPPARRRARRGRWPTIRSTWSCRACGTAFAEAYAELERPSQEVGVADWLALVFAPKEDGLAAIFKREGKVSAKRLGQIPDGDGRDAAGGRVRWARRARGAVRGGGAPVDCGRARGRGGGHGAHALAAADRDGDGGVPEYRGRGWIGSGCRRRRWRRGDEVLEVWWKALWMDEREPRPPTFGELRIDEGGHVVVAEVKEVGAA